MLVSDGSEYAESAVTEAIRLAKRCQANLYAFSVLATPDFESPLGQNLHELDKKAMVDNLLQVRAQAEAEGVSCEILLGHGSDPFDEIVDQAEVSAMDMIVMGRRDKSDLLRSMMGGTTAKVIGHTHSDVLVVPRQGKIEGKGIILPVDGSRNSEAAAATVVSMVSKCPVAVTLVSVAIDPRLREDAQGHADQLARLMADSGIAVQVETRIGSPDAEILACAQERGADLIVMGSHGRTGLDRLLVGSVSERVIGQAQCPVLIVKL
ncbi:MAG: universal stress protein [Gammaproteobacteria bacterium SHHR-1]